MKRFIQLLLLVLTLLLVSAKEQVLAVTCASSTVVDSYYCWANVDPRTGTISCSSDYSRQFNVSCNTTTCQTNFGVCSSNDVANCTPANGCDIWPCSAGVCGVNGELEGTCGNTAYPQCNGTCSGGNVCKAIANTGSCNCGQPSSCSEYVPEPNLLSTVRILPSTHPYTTVSARFRWTAINTTTYPYVDRIALVVAVKGTTDSNACKVAAIRGDATAPAGYNCNVYQPNLSRNDTSYTATGALTAGTEYSVLLYFVTQDPPGLLPPCDSEDTIDSYLSSCELTPDPTTVDVGGTRTLTSNLVGDTKWNVSFSRSPTAYATVTALDNASPYRTTVTGVADGVVTVTGDVRLDSNYNIVACSDTAEVTVGCVTSAPTAPILRSPSDGASLTNLTVPLDWSDSTWGTGCPTNSNQYLVYVSTSPTPTNLRATISTPVNSPTSNYNFTAQAYDTYYWKVVADNGPRATSSLIRSFTIAPAFSGVAWWQVEGAGIYAGLSVRSEVPSGNYLIIPGSLGSVGALMREAGTIDTGSGGLSTSAFSAMTKYQGKKMNFAYFGARLGFVEGDASDWSASNEITLVGYPTGQDYGYMKPVSGSATISSPMSVGPNKKYVIMVDGDLTISENITVTNGGYLMFIVKGNINIAPNVATLQGVYVTDGVFTTESVTTGNDGRLIVTGNVVAWSSVDLQRDLGSSGNSVPAEQFVYSRELILAMPDKIKAFVMEWQEVVPGSF